MNQTATAGASEFPPTDPGGFCEIAYSVPCILIDYFSLLESFNTWYMISKSYWTDPGSEGEEPGSTASPDRWWELIHADVASWNPHYVLSWPWIIADFVSCAILLAAAVYSFWLRKHTLAPDIFGYVSSHTRDNPHLPLFDGGSALSGIQRARQMQNVKIKIADVGGEGGMGRIGVVHGLNEDVTGLKKDRKYM